MCSDSIVLMPIKRRRVSIEHRKRKVQYNIHYYVSTRFAKYNNVMDPNPHAFSRHTISLITVVLLKKHSLNFTTR